MSERARVDDPPEADGLDSNSDGISELLRRIQSNDVNARRELFELLYKDLKTCARRLARGPYRTGSVCATALVGEVYVRLKNGAWTDRRHFLIAASQAMRHVLIDHHRAKRMGQDTDAVLDEIAIEYEGQAIDLEALHAAIERLKEQDSQMGEAVDLRYFGGRSEREAAELVGMSLRTYQRRWNAVRAWFSKELGKS
jgi:RNA polymerase sigma factor (TIGR02999 family)